MNSLWLLVLGLAVATAQAQSNQAPSQQLESNQVPTQASAPAAVAAQPTTSPAAPTEPSAAERLQPTAPEPADQGLQAHITKQVPQTLLLLNEAKPNEIIGKRFKFSGVLVQALKTDNLLQLFNPLAPAEYGAAEDNLLRDPISASPAGLKLFAIQF